jgi:hypothetical protein
MFVIANVTEVAAVLNRRRGFELAGVSELPLDIPKGATIGGRIEEGALERRHRPVNGALAPARDTCESVLGGGAKSDTRRR